jgi:hypothetical protein
MQRRRFHLNRVTCMRYFAVDCCIDAHTASVTVGAKEHTIDPPVAVASEVDALYRISPPQRLVALYADWSHYHGAVLILRLYCQNNVLSPR